MPSAHQPSQGLEHPGPTGSRPPGGTSHHRHRGGDHEAVGRPSAPAARAGAARRAARGARSARPARRPWAKASPGPPSRWSARRWGGPPRWCSSSASGRLALVVRSDHRDLVAQPRSARARPNAWPCTPPGRDSEYGRRAWRPSCRCGRWASWADRGATARAGGGCTPRRWWPAPGSGGRRRPAASRAGSCRSAACTTPVCQFPGPAVDGHGQQRRPPCAGPGWPRRRAGWCSHRRTRPPRRCRPGPGRRPAPPRSPSAAPAAGRARALARAARPSGPWPARCSTNQSKRAGGSSRSTTAGHRDALEGQPGSHPTPSSRRAAGP